MAAPVITVDMAFGSNPGDPSYTWTNIHTDGGGKTCVRDLGYQRGRLNELNQFQAGTGAVVLADKNSDFDPSNPSGVYSANMRPYVPVRARATIGGVTYPLFQHFAYSLPRTTRIASTYTERTVSTVDGFEWMANAPISVAPGNIVTYSQELTGFRATEVLNTLGWPVALRTIGAGGSTMQAATFNGDGTRALTHLLQAAQDESGMFFIDGAGKATFVQRSDLLTAAAYTTSQATFHDAVALGAGFGFINDVPVNDLQTTFNNWTVTTAGGTGQTANDFASQTMYGIRQQQLSSLVTTDDDALAQAQFKTSLYSQPFNRIESITVMPGTDTAFWQAVLPLEIGYRITIREQASGFAAPMSTDYLIQNINVHIPADGAALATFTFGLWPASTIAYWRAETTGFSEAQTTTKAAY
jgi:hypothetical protein